MFTYTASTVFVEAIASRAGDARRARRCCRRPGRRYRRTASLDGPRHAAITAAIVDAHLRLRVAVIFTFDALVNI